MLDIDIDFTGFIKFCVVFLFISLLIIFGIGYLSGLTKAKSNMQTENPIEMYSNKEFIENTIYMIDKRSLLCFLRTRCARCNDFSFSYIPCTKEVLSIISKQKEVNDE